MNIICGLIQGRHNLPKNVTTYIFTGDIPQDHICDSGYMERICNSFCALYNPTSIEVYVTGFTPALLALVKVCILRNIKLSAYNYDRETKTFWRQEVIK